MGFTWKIVKNDIPAIIAKLDEKAGRAVKSVAESVTAGVKERSPVLTGAMRDGYYYEMTGLASAEVRSGDNLDYPFWVEVGHHSRSGSWVPAQPHFIPAFDAAKDKLIEAAKAAGLFTP